MGEFAKKAAPMLGWEKRLGEQQKRLGTKIPSSEEEATEKAKENIAKSLAWIYAQGYGWRTRQRMEEGTEELLPKTDESLGVPGREVVISLPSPQGTVSLPSTERTRKLRKKAQEEVTVKLESSKPDSAYPENQLKKGMEVEKEHLDNPTGRKIITKDHLDESKQYYTGLKEMEDKLDKREEKKAGILGAMVAPIGESLEDIKLDAAQALDERLSRARRVTTDPSTLPWYYPAIVGQAPKQFMSGFAAAEKKFDEQRLKEITDKMDKAKSDFEQALAEEYRSSRAGIKSASAGQFINELALSHVKKAEGELNQMLGYYLSLASLLGTASSSSAYDWVAKRDPARQKLDAFREAIKQRMRLQPSPVQVELPVEQPEG